MWYNNFKGDAAWMAQVYTSATWRRLFPDPFYIFQVSHLSAVNVDPDELHILHLGCSMYFRGSVLWLLCYEVGRDTPEENMHNVWVAIAKEYRNTQAACQFSNLGLSSVCNKDKPRAHFPKLKGKGAEVKDLALPLSKVWGRMKTNAQMHNGEAKTFKALIGIQTILHSHAQHALLPTGIAGKLDDLVQSFLQEYTILANSVDKAQKLLFSMTPKFHYMWHLGKRAIYLNPRKGNTMMDEDFVGRCKDIVAACASGTEAHRVPAKVSERYSWGKYILEEYGL